MDSLFVSLVYCAESTVRWFVVREKHCWMAADCADKSKRTGRKLVANLDNLNPKHVAYTHDYYYNPGLESDHSTIQTRNI
jgi:hypothetical protein